MSVYWLLTSESFFYVKKQRNNNIEEKYKTFEKLRRNTVECNNNSKAGLQKKNLAFLCSRWSYVQLGWFENCFLCPEYIKGNITQSGLGFHFFSEFDSGTTTTAITWKFKIITNFNLFSRNHERFFAGIKDMYDAKVSLKNVSRNRKPPKRFSFHSRKSFSVQAKSEWKLFSI